MSDYLWHIKTLTRSGPFARVETYGWQQVIVLAWHADGKATVLQVGDDGPVVGAHPEYVDIDVLRFGRVPESEAAAA